MLYVIMCAGEGKRWNNYLGVPKHLVKINNETLIGRTTRLLKEKGITNYVITSEDERYKEYGITIPQTHKDCEVDRFEEIDTNEDICYLYGDVYYSNDAIKKIINTPTNDILFFGSDQEIFAIKIKNKEKFYKNKNEVKRLYLNQEIGRCIGWEVYRSINKIPFHIHDIRGMFKLIEDETDDIDFPQDYEKFKKERESNENSSR